MTNEEYEGCKLHAQYIWEETAKVDASQPYMRDSLTTTPMAIVFSNNDLHPMLGPGYLLTATSADQARNLAKQRTAKVDIIYREIKQFLLLGKINEAQELANQCAFKCICLCESVKEIVDFFLYLDKIGARGGGLSDSDFFTFPGYFVCTWTPDWSSVLDLFPDSEVDEV